MGPENGVNVRQQLKFVTITAFTSILTCFVLLYYCDETPFVGANLSYPKSMEKMQGYHYSDVDFDLTHHSTDNFNHECFLASDNSGKLYEKHRFSRTRKFSGTVRVFDCEFCVQSGRFKIKHKNVFGSRVRSPLNTTLDDPDV